MGTREQRSVIAMMGSYVGKICRGLTCHIFQVLKQVDFNTLEMLAAGYIVNLGTIANLRPISTKAKTMDTYEAITYSLYTNTKDLRYKNGIYMSLYIVPLREE